MDSNLVRDDWSGGDDSFAILDIWLMPFCISSGNNSRGMIAGIVRRK